MNLSGYLEVNGTEYPVVNTNGTYYLMRPDTQELVAYLGSDWQVIDMATNQPIGIFDPNTNKVVGVGAYEGVTGYYKPYEEKKSEGLNIPTDLYPFSKSQHTQQSWQASQSRQYLPKWAENLLKEIVTTLKNPSTFAYSIKPAINQAFTKTLADLAKRGVVGGRAGGTTVTSRALGEIGKAIPQAWGQALVGAGGLLGQARQSTTQSSGGSSGQSYTYQANPLAPYTLMGNLLELL